MKIGIVVNSSWNIYNFRAGLIKAFLKHHEVIAIAPNDGYKESLEEMGCIFEAVPMECKGTNPISDAILVKRLVDVYKKHKLDVVLHYTIKPNIYGTIAAKLLKIPSINNVTGLGTVFLREGISSKIAQYLYRFTFRFPKIVFFQNKDDRELFVNKKLINESIARLLPGSGIDTNHFAPKEPTFNFSEGEDKKEFTFLLIARVLYDKGIAEYADAIKLLRSKGIKARFQLLGKIDETKGLGVPRKQIKEWEKEGLLKYLGTTGDVRPLISNADCVVLPSYREGTPRTLLEAACLGKPIITTDVPGCRETVIHNFNGYLCEVKNAYDLSDKMQRMVCLSQDKLDEMGVNSRWLAETKFDQQIIIKKYTEVIDKVRVEEEMKDTSVSNIRFAKMRSRVEKRRLKQQRRIVSNQTEPTNQKTRIPNKAILVES
ncbi:glycosyltransferase family 4 protein [Bernardetia sp.]|uniref:glycosyltransferase family 4 protein n=1 Tax=Bernardetia sp. TaxID=1937974 RepID=UPI0025C48724|nr:glycosyltransferase family 4 protein [Bernardetia sp.]